MGSNTPQVFVGLHTDRYPPKFYLSFQSSPAEGTYEHVRDIIETRLGELERQVVALREILATTDPEYAEEMLFDSPRLQVTEVVLRPQTGRAALAEFVQQRFGCDAG